MRVENRQIKLGDKSIYAEQGNVTINYGEKKIKKILGHPPFFPEVFIGRDNDLVEVHDKLFKGENLLLLINGEGGIGKTAFASKYYHTYWDEYTHLGWVFAEKSLLDSLLTLAMYLQVAFDDTMAGEERLKVLLNEMMQLEKPCLLVIDNVNDLKDIESNYIALRTCSNFHLLLTTRITDFSQAKSHAIETLDPEKALELFRTYYSAYDLQEDALLRKILKAVGHNTLMIELLAKNLNNLNNKLRKRYQLNDLLFDLRKKGLLNLRQSKEVTTTYQSEESALRTEKPEAIIAAMYNLSELREVEKAMLSVFAVLPAENITFETLESLQPNTEKLDQTLLSLNQKGWIEYNEATASFKCSPVVQEVTRQQNKAQLFEHNELLVNTLIEKLSYERGTGHFINVTYEVAALYVRYAESAVSYITELRYELAILMERIGSYHKTTGNLDQALDFFEEYSRLERELCGAYPNNVSFKNGLAISFKKLGETYTAFGNLDQALEFFEEYSRLERELYKAYPNNVSYKNDLAISYSKLGNTHTALGNLDQALDFFEEYSRLESELYEAHPNNVSFKNGLAISYEKLGATHTAFGNLDQALEFFDKDLQLTKELYEAYPNNVSFKNGLAISYKKLGATHTAYGNLHRALDFFDKNLKLTKELYETYPNNVKFKNSLAISYSKLGEAHTALSNLDQALEFFKERSRLGKELYEAYPNNVKFKNGLAQSYQWLGWTYEKVENETKAKENYQLSKKLLMQLVSKFPEYTEFRKNLDWVENNLSE
jgi:Flp pilus assembly protein TadD